MKTKPQKFDLMKILVIGRSGQLARAFQKVSNEQGCLVETLGRPEYSFGLEEKIIPVIEKFKPDIIINASAWTNVDEAEDDTEGAYLGNVIAPGKISALAARYHLPFIHVSTDYVFDGENPEAYSEDDRTSPINQYGVTKLAGEKEVLKVNQKSIVARTAWLFSENNGNFVTTILNAAKKYPELKVTSDQIGNPTSAKALAKALIFIGRTLVMDWRPEFHDVFHITAPDATNRMTFVEEILNSQEIEKKPYLKAISTSEWPLPAKRPLNTSLSTKHLFDVFGYTLPVWRSQLVEVLEDRLIEYDTKL